MKHTEKTWVFIALACLFFIGTAANAQPQDASATQEREAEKAVRLANAAREKADEIAQEFGPDDTRETREKIGKAFFDYRWSARLPHDKDMAFYDEIARRFEKDAFPSIRVMAVEALMLKASAQSYHSGGFQWQDNMAPMLATYADIVRRFGDDPHPDVRMQVVKALIEKSERLREFAHIATYNEIDQRFGKDAHAVVQAQVIDALFRKADAHFKHEYHRVVEATAVLDEINSRFGTDPKVRQGVASAFLENRLYDHLVQRFRDDEDPGVQNTLALALFRKAEELHGLNEIKAADATREELFQRFGENPEILKTIVSTSLQKASNLRRRSNLQAAIAIEEEIFRRFGENPEILKIIAKGFFQNASNLHKQGETQARIAVEEEILRRFGENPEFQDIVMNILFRQAERLEDTRESLALYDRIGRFTVEKPEALRWRIARAMIKKTETLFWKNETKTALLFHDEIVRRFGKDEVFRRIMADAFFSRANTLCWQGNVMETLAIYDDVIHRFADNAHVVEKTVYEMSRNGRYLQLSGNPDAAIVLYDRIERHFGKRAQREIQLQIAEMLRWKSEALVWQGDLAAALALYDEIVRRFGGFRKESRWKESRLILALLDENIRKLENDDSFRLMVAQALYGKALILRQQGNIAGEAALYDELLQHIPVGKGSVLGEELLARVYRNQARILEIRGDFRGAIALYDKLIDTHLGNLPQKMLLYKSMALARMGEHEAAQAIHDEFGKYFGRKGQSVEERLAQAMLLEEKNPEAAIAAYEAIDRDAEGRVPQALLRKGTTLERQGKTPAAIAVYTEIVQRFGKQSPDAVREVVQQAVVARLVAQGKSGTTR
jgi:tetratricopeptide (TPR) repeat protein